MERVEPAMDPIKISVTASYNMFTITPPRGLNFGPVRSGAEKRTRQFEIRNDGVFGFDWCLLDLAALSNDPDINIQSMTQYGLTANRGHNADGSPISASGKSPRSPGSGRKKDKSPKANKNVLDVRARPPEKYVTNKVQIGPFTVEPASGTLEPEGEKSTAKITVTFEAVGDKDEDWKLGLWVDGIEPQYGNADLLKCGDFMALMYLLTGQSCIPGIDTNMQWVFEEQFVARNLEDAIATAGRVDIRCYCEDDRVFAYGPCLLGQKQTERLRVTNSRGWFGLDRLSFWGTLIIKFGIKTPLILTV